MQQRTPFNPMPESLDEGSARLQQPLQTTSEFATVQDIKVEAMPNSQRRAEIARSIDALGVTDAINEKITEERIDADIAAVKKVNLKDIRTPQDVLKALIAKGAYTKDVTLYDHVWTIRALEQRDLLLALDDIRDDLPSQAGRVTTLMFAQVVYAIEAIDGISLYEWFTEIKPRDYATTEEYKVAVKRALRRHLERMAPTIIDAFYSEYQKIDGERTAALLELKNS
jgi:hypothetical protein